MINKLLLINENSSQKQDLQVIVYSNYKHDFLAICLAKLAKIKISTVVVEKNIFFIKRAI